MKKVMNRSVYESWRAVPPATRKMICAYFLGEAETSAEWADGNAKRGEKAAARKDREEARAFRVAVKVLRACGRS